MEMGLLLSQNRKHTIFAPGVFVNKKVLQKGSKKVSTFNTQ